MIELSNQVTSLEVSKRLKEMGVKQVGQFLWQPIRKKKGMEIIFSDSEKFELTTFFLSRSLVAYTVAELLHILPAVIETDDTPELFGLVIEKSLLKTFSVGYPKLQWLAGFNNLADAVAELLIWGVKEEYITLEETNSKL